MRYAAFLRGINLGKRRVKGEQLCSALEAANGVERASAFLASGNVVFDYTGRRKEAGLATAIEEAIGAELGFESAVFLRSGSELHRLAELEPFNPAELEASKGKPQVILYRGAPDEEARRAVLELATADDRLAFSERELHWLPSAGILDSDLDHKTVDQLLGTGTQRTKNTINRITKKYFDG